MTVESFRLAACLVGAVVAAVLGCGGPAFEYDSVVTGTVTIDGELARSGTVTFHPVEKGGRPAIGRIHSDGSYSLRTGQGDLSQVDGGTVMPGEYVVTVTINAPAAEGAVVGEGGPPLPGPSLIASKYAQRETTDLRHTVKPGKQVIVLKLDRAEPQQPAEQGSDETDPETTAPEAVEVDPADVAPQADAATNAAEPVEEKSEDSEGKSP